MSNIEHHKTEALDFMRIAGESGDWVPQAAHFAQVHATLALAESTEQHAEQQRIANLLAFLSTPSVTPDGWLGWHSTAQGAWRDNREIERRKISDEIREGLGLA